MSRCDRAVRGRRAFTLLELLVAVAILSVLVAILLPAMTDDYDVRMRSTATIITSDIEYAQVLTISDPKEPVIVVFDPPNDTYWLAFESDPTQPIPRPGSGEPYEVTLGVGRAWAAEGVVISITDMPKNTIRFNAHGGLKEFASTPTIHVNMDAKSKRTVEIRIHPTTGRVTEKFVDY